MFGPFLQYYTKSIVKVSIHYTGRLNILFMKIAEVKKCTSLAMLHDAARKIVDFKTTAEHLELKMKKFLVFCASLQHVKMWT